MIQAIETRYAGCRFRSRLEARWAVFFDHLRITWEYEPEGYRLPSGPYLPDFKLYGLGGDGTGDGLWFEVKPHLENDLEFGMREDPRWYELAKMTGIPLITAFGMPRPDYDLVWGSPSPNGWMEIFWGEGWDNGRAFCYCNVCGRLGIAYSGWSNRVCNHPGNDKRIDTAEDPRIVVGYTIARSARFEHGERGA